MSQHQRQQQQGQPRPSVIFEGASASGASASGASAVQTELAAAYAAAQNGIIFLLNISREFN